MVRLGYPVVGVTDLDRAVAFWTAALGLVVSREERPTGEWVTLDDAERSIRVLGLQLSETSAEPFPRVHLDLFVDSEIELEREVQRLIGLGASEVHWDRYPALANFLVLGDPDGNRFCIVDVSRTEK